MGRGGLAPPRKSCKVLCALVMTVKRSVDKLFTHYFQNICRLLMALTPDRIGALSLNPAEGREPRSPNLPTVGKNPADANDRQRHHRNL